MHCSNPPPLVFATNNLFFFSLQIRCPECPYQLNRPCHCQLRLAASAYPSEELRRAATTFISCRTGHKCVDAHISRPVLANHSSFAAGPSTASSLHNTSIDVRLSWNVQRCPHMAPRNRLHSLAHVNVNQSEEDAVVLRCGYSFAPPPWPGVAVLPVQFAMAANNTLEQLLAEARVLLLRFRFVEASHLLTDIIQGPVSRSIYMEALRLQLETLLKLGHLDAAELTFEELHNQIQPDMQSTLADCGQRLQRARQAWTNWTTLTGDESCDGVMALVQLASAAVDIHQAVSQCCFEWGGCAAVLWDRPRWCFLTLGTVNFFLVLLLF